MCTGTGSWPKWSLVRSRSPISFPTDRIYARREPIYNTCPLVQSLSSFVRSLAWSACLGRKLIQSIQMSLLFHANSPAAAAAARATRRRLLICLLALLVALLFFVCDCSTVPAENRIMRARTPLWRRRRQCMSVRSGECGPRRPEQSRGIAGSPVLNASARTGIGAHAARWLARSAACAR